MSETLTGVVEPVTFENEATGFRVVRLSEVSGAKGKNRLTIVGRFSFVGPGTSVRVSGRFEENSTHGERFVVESLLVVTPETSEGLVRYLGSGAIKGIGPATAEKIVQFFGKEALSVLDTAPHRLLEVPGLGRKKVSEIRASYEERKSELNLQVLLASLGEGAWLARRLIEKFGSRAQEKLEQEPYLLAETVSGVGFLTADRLAMRQGLSKTHPDRLRAGLLHCLFVLGEDGHTAEDEASLVARAAELLKVPENLVAVELDALWAAEKVVKEGTKVQSRDMRQAEETIAFELSRLSRGKATPLAKAEAFLEEFENKASFRFTEEQSHVLREVTRHSVAIVTGGPGVGKTTIVAALVDVMKRSGIRFALAAPTGRAAKRMSEATKQPALTIHRLLEVEPQSGRFKRNRENRLEAEFVLVDEVSMLDVALTASLLVALPENARLVFVGDKDQLPSVGAGAVLRDLLASRVIAALELSKIHRQSETSGIISGARNVLGGRVPEGGKSGEELSEFYVVASSDRAKLKELLLTVVLERIPGRFGLDPKRDLQVLAPMHRGDLGTEGLNEALATRITGAHEGARFLPGDRVIQLKNNYDLDIYNGYLGEVVTASNDAVLVNFESASGSREVTLTGKGLGDLSLAYAISIHKSQGSEFPVVVIPLSMSHFVMLHRKLLYTAITRAKKLCVLVVEPKALSLAVSELKLDERKTLLGARLAEAFGSS